MTFAISCFQSALDVSPRRVECSWLEFITMFFEPRRTPCSQGTCARENCVHKRGPCWSPAVRAVSGNRLEKVSLLSFDIERVSDDQLDEVRGRLGDYRYLIHSTHSDRPDSRCVRIVIELSQPVVPVEWRPFWLAARQRFVPFVDSICSDAGRIFFLPSCAHDAGYFVQVNDGAALDVDVVLEAVASPRTDGGNSSAEGAHSP